MCVGKTEIHNRRVIQCKHNLTIKLQITYKVQYGLNKAFILVPTDAERDSTKVLLT